LGRPTKKLDKIVIILTGQPRGVSLYTWRRTFVDVILDYTRKNNIELHVICATWEYDSLDRYILADPTKSGFDSYPIKFGTNVIASQAAMYNLFYNESEQKTYSGTVKIKRDKWENYQRQCWGDTTNLYFTYVDPYSIVNMINKHYKDKSLAVIQDTPSWVGQFIMIDQIYKDHSDLFKTFTKSTFALRSRYDVAFSNREDTLYHIISNTMGNSWDDNDYNIMSTGMDLSPVMCCQRLFLIKGFFTINDYWQAYDGPGIQTLGEKFLSYLIENPDARLPGYSNNAIDIYKRDQTPNRSTLFYKIPESVIAQFHYENFYTAYCLQFDCLLLQSFHIWATDQWRYEWYEWTTDMLEKCRINN
jgi:hypothetical protein